jgi:ribosomal protein L40E
MAVFPEATKRLFHNIYVCKQCKHKKRAQPLKVQADKVSCRNCGSKRLRPVRRK